jgi:hypothetical protein
MNPYKTTCPLQTDNADVLLDYCSRSLDPERRAMLEAHMHFCADCREMAAGQMQVWEALEAFEAEPVSADFDRRLYARIEEMERVPAWERWMAPVRAYLAGRPAWQPALSLAAAGLALALVFVVRQDAGTPGDNTTAAIASHEIEQAERTLEDLEMLRQFEAFAAGEAAAQEDGAKPVL